MKLENIVEILALNFDLDSRLVDIIQINENAEIETQLKSLGLGCKLVSAQNISEDTAVLSPTYQRKLLWWALVINLAFFIIEFTSGLLSKSMGLMADSLDMFADSIVYGLSLWAVGAAINKKKLVAKVSGYLQILLASLGFVEILRRLVFLDTHPNYQTMILVSFFALMANAATMFILNKSKSKDANMQASKIFTSNDIIINIGVILAGFAVLYTHSFIPDLLVGTAVFIIVIRGAIRILKLT